MNSAVSELSLRLGETSAFKNAGGQCEKPANGKSPSGSRDPQELKKACSEFESLFIFHLLKEMRATVPKSGFLSGGRREDMYLSMFDAQIAREMASTRGIGLSNLLMKHLNSGEGGEEKPVARNEKKS